MGRAAEGERQPTSRADSRVTVGPELVTRPALEPGAKHSSKHHSGFTRLFFLFLYIIWWRNYSYL